MNRILDAIRTAFCRRPNLFAAAGLFAFSLVNFLPFYNRVLYSDDFWNFPGSAIFNPTGPWLTPPSRRPLETILPRFLLSIFHLQLDGFYAFLIAELFLTAFLVFLLISRLESNRPWLALGIAALFLAYPADYSRMWLSTINIHLVWILALAFALFFWDYSIQPRSKARLVYATGLLAFSLGIHEIQLGFCLFWTLLVIGLSRRRTGRWDLSLLSPFVIAAIFLVWRTLGVSASGANDPYLAIISFDPIFVVVRFIYAVRVAVLGWIDPLGWWLGQNLPVPAVLAAWSGFTLLWIAVAARWLPSPFHPIPTDRLNNASFLNWFLLGAGFFSAGLCPVIFLFLPNLDETASRVNAFAILGMAVLLTAPLQWAVNRFRKGSLLFFTGLLPFLVFGTLVNWSVQQASAAAWNAQKQIWRDVTRLVTNLNPACPLTITLTDRTNLPGAPGWTRSPLIAPWEIDGALKVLYNQPALTADLILLLPDQAVPIGDPPAGVSFRYQFQPDGALILAGQNIPPDCVLPPTGETARYRFLIE